MNPVITPCRVPWSVSPTMDGLTLTHSNDDEPRCSIVFGGGRLTESGLTDDRRIEINFASAYFARVSAKDDNEDIDASGFTVVRMDEGPSDQYLEWRRRRWRQTGFCPESGFYVATESPWLTSAGFAHLALRHFVLAGRDNYIEVLASGFAWREWMWPSGPRDQYTDPQDVVGSGEGVE
ncbi:MAG: hypothetical protein ABUS57_05455 [Pseudomonadota bacterium]